jgi:hypothetical protein
MPIDKRRESRIVAAIVADILGADDDAGFDSSVEAALERVDRFFAPAIAKPIALVGRNRIDGALADPAQAPLCISVLRELIAPAQLRVGVGIGDEESRRHLVDANRDATSIAHQALRLATRDDGLSRYLGTGEQGDVLLGALCRLVDPLLRARTRKQWEAIAAYRELGHQRDVAAKLGVTRQSVGDRLSAGHRRAVEDADVAIATYLSHVRRQRLSS